MDPQSAEQSGSIRDEQAISGVLTALRDYSVSETAMRRRTRSAVDMNQTDLLALRYLIEAERADIPVRPKELSVKLGMSSASTTSVVVRLVVSGHITRELHPTDRRAVHLRTAAVGAAEVLSTRAHTDAIIQAIERLTPEQAGVVTGFLADMREAVEAIDRALPG